METQNRDLCFILMMLCVRMLVSFSPFLTGISFCKSRFIVRNGELTNINEQPRDSPKSSFLGIDS